APPRPTARAWSRENLFNNRHNSALTVLLGAGLAMLAAYGARFLFVTGQWAPVRTNLTLLMMGTFPRAEQWRVVVQVYLLCAAAGLVWGGLTASSRDRAADADVPFSRARLRDGVRRWWPLFVLLAVLLGMTRTWLPLAFVASALAGGVVARRAMEALPEAGRRAGWFGAGVCALAGWQVVSGTGGIAWWWGSALVAAALVRITGNVRSEARWQPAARLALIAGAVAVVWAVYGRLDFGGVGWDDWSGFQLNLVAAAASIVLAFPVGLAAAIGRRSQLPAVRWLSVGYIELIRGVPLITLLFMGDLFLGFFLPTEDPLSKVTRAIAVMTLFTGAYLAEIVRGGLQAVPRGQVEAAWAVGLSAPRVLGLIVLPQALRAVIPALVGQFINLFKDSTLLSIIALTEILRIRESIHGQREFLVTGIAETLVFVAFAFWALAFTMSRESQRLERRLGVGER
ncbi:MAG: amino acid ABC transporter permease, partial [Acidimicrobiia bacterium]|nr:amino acid ABC transporter permease [Acidimicrobiia bacterium]